MFPRAFTLALLVTRTIVDCTPTLFGWRQGRLSSRGFHVIGGRTTSFATGPSSANVPGALADAGSDGNQSDR